MMEHMLAQMMLSGKGKGKGENHPEAVQRTFSGKGNTLGSANSESTVPMPLPMDNIPLNEETKPMVLMIMNNAHADALLLILHHYAHYGGAATAELADLDDTSMTLLWTSSKPNPGSEHVRWSKKLPYVSEDGSCVSVNTVADCRRTLVGMARRAAESLGVEIESPKKDPASSAASTYVPTPRSRIRTLSDSSSTEGEAVQRTFSGK